MKKGFVTGSRVYGRPTMVSDIDLVLLVSDEDRKLLTDFSDITDKKSIRYGNLNLIFCETEHDLECWRIARKRCLELCHSIGSLTREQSIQIHDIVAKEQNRDFNKRGYKKEE